MTDEEMAEIPEQKLKDISEGRILPSQIAAWKMAKCVLRLIAEVRRLKGELDKANLAIEMLGGHPLT